MTITKVLRYILAYSIFFLLVNLIIYSKPFHMMFDKEHYKSVELEIVSINNKIRDFFN